MGLPTVGCDVEGMLCLLLWECYTRDPATALAERTASFQSLDRSDVYILPERWSEGWD